jgi:ankyrin repeat protein
MAEENDDLVVDIGIDPDEYIAENEFLSAIKNNKLDKVKRLIRESRNKNALVNQIHTIMTPDAVMIEISPLGIASFELHIPIMKELIAAGANVNALTLELPDAANDDINLSPLMLAVQERDGEATVEDIMKAVKVLIDGGAKINLKNNMGSTVTHEVCFTFYDIGQNDILKYLVKKGANLDIINGDGYTPLMYTIMHNRPEMAKTLIDGGANVNIIVGGVNSALYSAAHTNPASKEKRIQIVKMLLKAGADPHLKVGGKTMFERAENDEFVPEINELISRKERRNVRSRITRRVLRPMNQLPPELTEYIAEFAEGPVRNLPRRLRPLPSVLRGFTAKERKEMRNEAAERARMNAENGRGRSRSATRKNKK